MQIYHYEEYDQNTVDSILSIIDILNATSLLRAVVMQWFNFAKKIVIVIAKKNNKLNNYIGCLSVLNFYFSQSLLDQKLWRF